MNENEKVRRLLEDKILIINGKEYPLRLVTEKELFQIRMKCKPGIVLLYDSELFYSELPSDRFKLSGEKWLTHRCSEEKDCCYRLSAMPAPQGCDCIRDRGFRAMRREGYRLKDACELSFRIEKYKKFISVAIESFGMTEDGLKILACKNYLYKKSTPQKVTSPQEHEQLIVELAQHLNPDIEKYQDLKKRLDVRQEMKHL